jgi:hypothetical protein
VPIFGLYYPPEWTPMKLNRQVRRDLLCVGALSFSVWLDACGSSPSAQSRAGNLPNGTTLTAISGKNVLPITVNGSLCSKGSYFNKPCVSVTVCTPDNSSCAVISDLLVDTGSYGLRVFKSALPFSLSALSASTASGAKKSLAECVQFGDGSSQWGPVSLANVGLGSEPSVRVPIQVIDSTFPGLSSNCGTPDVSPAATGFNGILGVGLMAQDCGASCSVISDNQMYYGCSGNHCSGTTVSLGNQVQNPVALLPTDNNGIILELPDIKLGGAASLSGYLVLGIGTQTNNTPGTLNMYAADSMGEFFTQIANQVLSGFIDSGSNGLFFSGTGTSSLSPCTSFAPGWFCPTGTLVLSAQMGSPTGTFGADVVFNLGNMEQLMGTANSVYAEIGGNAPGLFDWGLPFFIGRNVYVGIEGTTSALGSGPYWAY